MPYWLCYTPCVACSGQCAACEHRNLPVNVHVIESEAQPAHAVNGPCATADELLGVMSRNFTFGEDGLLRLRM
jgi:hypothetical protein